MLHGCFLCVCVCVALLISEKPFRLNENGQYNKLVIIQWHQHFGYCSVEQKNGFLKNYSD